MSLIFAFITVFALFSVLTTNAVSAAPLDTQELRSATSPAFFTASADLDLYLGQKTRRRGGGGRVWSNLYYGDTRLKPKDDDKINPSFYGIQLGFDVKKSHGVHTTCFINVNQSRTTFSGDSSTIDNYLIGYGKHIYLSACHFTYIGSIGYDRYALSDGGTARGDGLQTNFFGEFGFDFKLAHWVIKPFYALQYDFLYHGNIGNSPVAVSDWNAHSLQQLAGLRLNWGGAHSWELQSRAVWVHELLDNPPPFYHMRFSPMQGINTPAIMFYEGNTGRDWAWLGIGGKLECTFNVYLFFDYDVLFNTRHTTHLGSAGLLLGW